MIRYYYITLLLLTLSTACIAQIGTMEFVENKGQWDNRIKFKSDVPAGAFYIRSGGFTVLQHNENDLVAMQNYAHGHTSTLAKDGSPFVLRSHAYAVDFAGASDKLELVPDKAQPQYNNYIFGNDPSKWGSQCKVYLGITAKDVYPGVDVRYYTDNGTMKYDIIVKPGAELSRIVLRYAGADKLEVKDKQLLIKTSVGDVKEMEPYTYQFDKGQRKQISAKYLVTGNEVRFDIKNYNRNEVLVIDPTVIFVSFSGSTGSNWGFTATYGADGSFYGGGINLSTGFPVTTGAFQTTFGGGSGNPPADISIIKLNSFGTARIYATYIGGSSDEQPHSLVEDAAGNLVIAGRTNSALTGVGSFPLLNGGADIIGTCSDYDIIVVKLNATGSALAGSKRIGGTGLDGANITASRSGSNSLQQNYGDDGRSEVIIDGSGNIYVASCTRSLGNAPNGFPVTAGAFQSSPGGGGQEAVVLKFTSNLTRIFSSYLGGNGDDAGYVLSLAPNGNIYVAGGTSSTDFPGSVPGVIHSTNQGGIDGFVSIINSTGTAIIRSTYIGTGATDQVFGIQFDNVGFPYICGQTKGNWTISPAGIYGVAGAPQFIAKMQPDLSAFVYSTAFGRQGPNPNISITAFLVDNCENVYVSGWGGVVVDTYPSSGTNPMPLTADAIPTTPDGRDFYFFVLKKNATQQLFGSYFGQNGGVADHVDGGTSRFDKQGVIYQAVCGNCSGGAVFPVTPGVAGPTNLAAGSNGCNLAMIKIAFDFAGVDAGLQSMIDGVPRDTAGCVPLTVDFRDTVANGVKYYWYFGDGSLPNPAITTTPNISHTYNTVGVYQVMLIAEDSTTCNIRDTAYINIRVGNLEAFPDFDFVKFGPCDSLKYQFNNLSIAPPGRPFTNQSFIWNFGDNTPPVTAGAGPVLHTYASPGSYTVKLYLVDTAYCNAPDSIVKTISIAPLVQARFVTPPTGCAPYTAVFTDSSIAGQTYQWDFGDGGTSTLQNPTHLYANPGTYNIRFIVTDPNTCNITDTAYGTITVYPIPVSDFSFSPDPPVENTPTTFNNLASPDAINFKWLFGDGDSLVTASRLPVQHQYNATGTYNACLVAINAAGCADTLCRDVRAVIAALVDLPNAFTPQSGGINSRVMVRGFGITKMRFIIWNRWGQKVFETSDKDIGWDGKYRGALQPMDVYAYTLDVEFFDGTKTTKKGDITLIR